MLCDRVLEEQDGVLTAIRLIDRVVAVAPEGTPVGPIALPKMTLLVSLKSGDYVGKGVVTLRLNPPAGVEGPKEIGPGRFDVEVELSGAEHGANVMLELNLVLEHQGVYWFDVYFNDEMITRTPLAFVRTTSPSQSKSAIGSAG